MLLNYYIIDGQFNTMVVAINLAQVEGKHVVVYTLLCHVK
jgi:hypothetical protein